MDTVSNFILADAIEQATPAQKRRILAQLMEWQRVELRATALTICHDDEAPVVERWLVQVERSRSPWKAVPTAAPTLSAAIDKLAEAEAIRAHLSV